MSWMIEYFTIKIFFLVYTSLGKRFFFFMEVIQYTFICKYFVTYVNDPICNIKLHQTKRLTK